MLRYKNCAYFGCSSNSYVDKNTRFYNFRKETFKEWVAACGNPEVDLDTISKATLLRSYFVCDKHFDDNSFVDASIRYKLVDRAIPISITATRETPLLSGSECPIPEPGEPSTSHTSNVTGSTSATSNTTDNNEAPRYVTYGERLKRLNLPPLEKTHQKKLRIRDACTTKTVKREIHSRKSSSETNIKDPLRRLRYEERIRKLNVPPLKDRIQPIKILTSKFSNIIPDAGSDGAPFKVQVHRKTTEVNKDDSIFICEVKPKSPVKATSKYFPNILRRKTSLSFGEKSNLRLDTFVPSLKASISAPEKSGEAYTSHNPGEADVCIELVQDEHDDPEDFECIDVDIDSPMSSFDSESDSGIGCQTDFSDEEDDNNNDLPVIFCSIYSSVNEVETLCNIPLSKTLCKQCAKSVCAEDRTTNLYYSSLPSREPLVPSIEQMENSDHFEILSVNNNMPAPLIIQNLPFNAPTQVIPNLPLSSALVIPSLPIRSDPLILSKLPVDDMNSSNSQNNAQEVVLKSSSQNRTQEPVLKKSNSQNKSQEVLKKSNSQKNAQEAVLKKSTRQKSPLKPVLKNSKSQNNSQEPVLKKSNRQNSDQVTVFKKSTRQKSPLKPVLKNSKSQNNSQDQVLKKSNRQNSDQEPVLKKSTRQNSDQVTVFKESNSQNSSQEAVGDYEDEDVINCKDKKVIDCKEEVVTDRTDEEVMGRNDDDVMDRNDDDFMDRNNEDVMDCDDSKEPRKEVTVPRIPPILTMRKCNPLVEMEEEEKSFWASMEEKTDYFRILRKNKVRKKFERPRWKRPRKEFSGTSLLSELLVKMNEVNSDESKVLLTDSEEENVTVAEINLTLEADLKERRQKRRADVKEKRQKVVCDICGSLSATERTLTAHIARVHREHPIAKEYKFRCVCTKLFKYQESLSHHLSLNRGPCDICGKTFKCYSLFYSHKLNHNKYKRCKICKKQFSLSKEMRNHVKLVHSETVHYCDVCGIRLYSSSSLQKHIETIHMIQGQKITEPRCVKCDYVARNFQSLRVHYSLTHKKEMTKDSEKYHCRFCNVALLSKYNLRNHEQKHDGHFKGPKCDLCKRTFYKQELLNWHKRKFHGIEKDDDDSDSGSDDTCSEKPLVSKEQKGFPCQLCELCFTSLHLLQVHTLSVHNTSKGKNFVERDTVYECPYCSISLCSSHDLQNHLLSVHNVSCNMNSEKPVEISSITNVSDDYSIIEIGPLN